MFFLTPCPAIPGNQQARWPVKWCGWCSETPPRFGDKRRYKIFHREWHMLTFLSSPKHTGEVWRLLVTHCAGFSDPGSWRWHCFLSAKISVSWPSWNQALPPLGAGPATAQAYTPLPHSSLSFRCRLTPGMHKQSLVCLLSSDYRPLVPRDTGCIFLPATACDRSVALCACPSEWPPRTRSCAQGDCQPHPAVSTDGVPSLCV